MMRSADPAGASVASATMPRMDISESSHDVRMDVELPGMSESDVQVELAGDVLTIRGEKRAARDDAQRHLTERSFGSFTRSLRLSFAPRPEEVQAVLMNGVLSITLPKAPAHSHAHRIPVHGGDGADKFVATRGAAAAVAGHPTPDTTWSSTASESGVEVPDGKAPAAHNPVQDGSSANHPI
jgi:HSP20 family protein